MVEGAARADDVAVVRCGTTRWWRGLAATRRAEAWGLGDGGRAQHGIHKAELGGGGRLGERRSRTLGVGSSVMVSCSVVEVVGGHDFSEEEEVDTAWLEGVVVNDDIDEGR